MMDRSGAGVISHWSGAWGQESLLVFGSFTIRTRLQPAA